MTLSAQLRELESSQLVRHADEAYMAYMFKHVLVQETTYSSLLKGDRQRLHLAIADCIETSEPDRLDENAARLEQHYAAAGNHIKALDYARRAGAFAAKRFANAEATEHYTFALDLLKRYGGTSDDYRNVYLERGRALQETGMSERALQNYLELETFGRARNDASLELAGLIERATLYAIPSSVHNPQLGMELNEQALALARAQGDRRTECKTLWNMMLVAYFQLEPALAVEYGEKALVLARELGWQEMEGYILNDICRPLISIGPPERVLELLAQARVLLERQKSLPLLADNLAATGQTTCFYGNYEASSHFEQQATQLARTIGSSWALAYSRFSSIALAMARGQMGRVREMIRELEDVPVAMRSIMSVYGTRGWVSEIALVLGDLPTALNNSRDLVNWAKIYPLGRAWTLGNLVRDLTLNGELDQAKLTLASAHQEKLTDFYSFGPTSVAFGEAELALALKDGEWALRVATTLIDKLQELGIVFFLPAAYLFQGRALALLQEPDRAAQAFDQALALGAPIPARLVMWETLQFWATMEQARGATARANELLAQAAEIVMYIANQWETPALRKQFLNQPRVRALFDSIAAAST